MGDRLRPIVVPSGAAVRPVIVDVTPIFPIHPSLPRLLAIRERDHVVLEVSWSGLQQKQDAGEPVLTRTQNGDGFLILIFPAQHLLEKAYYQILDQPKETEVNPEYEGPTAPPPKNEKVIPVILPEEPPEPPPIQATISDTSRLVFRVPQGTTIPLTVAGVLDWAGRLELSVPANALPRQRSLNRFVVTADSLMARTVAFRGTQDLVDRLVTAGRLRRRVMGSGPMVAEDTDALRTIFEPHLLVEPQGRDRGLGGVTAMDSGTIVGSVVDAYRLKRPKPALPTETQTAIESPYRLLISPSQVGGWAHATEVVEHDGRAELWHTRLGVRVERESDETGTEIVVDEASDFQRVVRAVWALPTLAQSNNPPPPSTLPYRASLDDRDRHNFVHLSSNFAITQSNRRYQPDPVVVNRLMLTSMGSWMDFEARWDPWPKGLNVEEWIHRATLGRDHYVRVVYQGFLCFPGNKTTLVKISERMFASDVPDKNWGQTDNPAYVTQRMFLVIKEQEKLYTDNKATFEGDKLFANAMPLQSVKILDRQTPDLDPPDDPSKFVPHVGNVPYLFTIVATDVEGNQHTTETPLLFVDKSVDDEPEAKLEPALTALYNGKPLATVDFHGQRIAYGPAKSLDDTTFETRSITFEATVPDGPLPDAGPHFHPRMVGASVDMPAVRQLTGASDPLDVALVDDFVKHGFKTGGGNPNKGELLFRLTSPKNLNLSDKADKAGGLASPSMKISAISRLTGPVAGQPDLIRDAKFEPSSFFSGIEAYLFGVIPLSAVIDKVANIVDELERVPRFIGNTMDQVEEFLDDIARIFALVAAHAALAATVQTEIDNVLTAVEQMLSGGAPDLDEALNDLDDALGNLEAALPGPLDLGTLNDVKALIGRVRGTLQNVATLVTLVENLVKGIELPRSMSARFEWRPKIKPWPETNSIFVPASNSLVLAAEARGSVDNGGGDLVVSAALENFELKLIGDKTTFIILQFEKIQILIETGKKPEIDVVLKDVVFTGVLEFVQTLKDLIPLDAFSDPPAVTVDTSGIRADLSIGLPNVSVGVFSLENLSLGGGFVVPFVGEALSVYFRFCERENPALVSVSMFAGGFFFGITIDPGGVRILEAAIEFGANVSMDFGVASGGVSAMAGIYFKLENDDATLAGYFRVRGHVRALGIVTVSIELYLELSYEFATDKCVGRAELKISIELFLFEATITISCEKKFAGSGNDPTFAETMAPYQLVPSDPSSPVIDPWEEYCVAFA